jgi:hypothetical protein
MKIFVVAKFLNGVAQAIVAAVAAPLLKAGSAGFDIQFVVGN